MPLSSLCIHITNGIMEDGYSSSLPRGLIKKGHQWLGMWHLPGSWQPLSLTPRWWVLLLLTFYSLQVQSWDLNSDPIYAKSTCFALHLWDIIETIEASGQNLLRIPLWLMAGDDLILPGGVNLIRSPCPHMTVEHLSYAEFLVTFSLDIHSCSETSQALSHKS